MSYPSRCTPQALRWLACAVLVATTAAAPALAQPVSVYGTGLFQLGDGEPPSGFPGTATPIAVPGSAAPDWSDLFGVDGWAADAYPSDASGTDAGNGVPDYAELYGGLWVAFTADNEDAPAGFEPSARGGGDHLVVNGSAAPSADLDTLLGYLAPDGAGNLVAYLAASRVAAGTGSLALELNQDFVHVGAGGFGQGRPWAVVGGHTDGDLLIELRYSDEVLESAALKAWRGGGWTTLRQLAGEGCDGRETFCVLGNASAVPAGPWAAASSLAPGTFVEIGIAAGHLVGFQPQYLTLQARTVDDLAFAYFSAEGR